MSEQSETSAGAVQDERASRDGDQTGEDALAEAIDRLMPEDALDDDRDTFVAKGGERKKGPDEERETRKPSKKALHEEGENEPDEDDEEEDELEELPGDDDDLELAASADKDEDEDEEEGQDDEAALEHAYEVLLRAKRAPFSVLKRTPKATLIAWAESVESDQAEGSSGGNGQAQHGRDTDASSKGTTSPAQGEAPTWEAMRALLAEKLGVDDDAADSLKPFFDRQAALEKRLDAYERSTAEREGRRNISTELRRLTQPYPELKDNSKKRDKVIDAALTLAAGLQKRGTEVNPEKVFDQAARMVLGAPKRSDLKQLRRNGLANVPYGNRGGLGVERSEVEFWDKAVGFAESGKPELIKRMRMPGGKTTKPAERFVQRR